MLETEARRYSFALVGNIPSVLRSSDLRAFFSHLVEKGGFFCFHYRHRPEHLTPSRRGQLQTDGVSTAVSSSELSPRGGYGGGEGEASEFKGAAEEVAAEGDGVRAAASRCCVVAVERRWEKELLRRYRNRSWAKASGESVGGKVRITKLSVSFEEVTTRSMESEAGEQQRHNLMLKMLLLRRLVVKRQGKVICVSLCTMKIGCTGIILMFDINPCSLYCYRRNNF